MKYIVTKDEKGTLEIFTFSRAINHDCFAQAVAGIRNEMHGDYRRVRRIPVSAGFVSGGICYGESLTLGLKSRDEDSDLLDL